MAVQAAEMAQKPMSILEVGTEEDKFIEFGEQLATQWTIQVQEQQQELAQKVLAAQAETAERHMGEVASVRREVDQELGRMGSVGESLRSQVSGLEQVLAQTLKQQQSMAERMEVWMQAQSAQQVAMLQQSKQFAEQRAQTSQEATQRMLLKVVQDSEGKLEAFQQEVKQRVASVEMRGAAREEAAEVAAREEAARAACWAQEQREATAHAATQQVAL